MSQTSLREFVEAIKTDHELRHTFAMAATSMAQEHGYELGINEVDALLELMATQELDKQLPRGNRGRRPF